MMDDFDQSEKSLPISKSQRKRDVTALQVMGQKLMRLSSQQLKKLDLPDPLLQALIFGRSVTQNGALRRHLQYIGRLMRELDEETVHKIKQFLETFKR